MGNAPALAGVVGLSKRTRLSRGVEGTHDQITFIMKSFFFTFIGIMLGPPWVLVALGAVLGMLLLAARIPIVAVGMLGSSLPWPARGLVTVSMPRGMAAGVLAMSPAQAGIEGTADLPVVVYAAVILTILLFAVGFPIFRRRLAGVDLELFGDEKKGRPPATTQDSLPACWPGLDRTGPSPAGLHFHVSRWHRLPPFLMDQALPGAPTLVP